MAVSVALVPAPQEAVGGRPILVRDGAIAAGVDTAGGPTFGPVRHPRTAVGIAGRGRRLLLVVVDGRQKPYSDGMTLGELARLMQSLGAANALNLDGGGSTALAVRDPHGPGVRVRNSLLADSRAPESGSVEGTAAKTLVVGCGRR